MIMTAKDFVEENYNAEVIYGDTDSIFCKFPLKDSNSNPVYGKQALEYAIRYW
jgi:DNA polymerase elongation subunit (family B)